MKEFFARLYEWFGIIPLYSHDMARMLNGWDISCTGYYALPGHLYVGISMIIVTALIFALQYDLIDQDRFLKDTHWGIAALVVFIINFLFAFIVPFASVFRRKYCPSLNLSAFDCILFGLSNAIWGLILFSILSGVQRLVTRSKKS